MKYEKSDGSVGDETERGVLFTNLPLMITKVPELSALEVRPTHFRAIVQRESKVLPLQIVEDIMFRSSIKVLTGSKDILFR